jgi:hypothetical protein
LNRELVVDQPAATPRQDRWALGKNMLGTGRDRRGFPDARPSMRLVAADGFACSMLLISGRPKPKFRSRRSPDCPTATYAYAVAGTRHRPQCLQATRESRAGRGRACAARR